MANAFFKIPEAKNEPVCNYAPGMPETVSLLDTYKRMKNEFIDVPMYIGGKPIFTNNKITMHPPHELKTTLGTYSRGDKSHVKAAIDAALAAKSSWEMMPWEDRAAIFLKAADLISGPYRDRVNASTMLAQSKNVYQAEVDAVCELCDFLRFNVQYMTEIYKNQPINTPAVWNRMEYRPLEGFVFALTPFNFTAIAGNLCATPAMCGNTVVWKPADSQIYSARLIMEIYREAGLPDGVINLIYTDGPETGDVVLNHKEFAGLHFTGSTTVFNILWKSIGEKISTYTSYPRIVGETGGKDYVMVHPSAKPIPVAVGLVRASFEFQGQKCSASSRAYIPKSLWSTIKNKLIEDIKTIKMGSPEDPTNFVNAVIDERAFDKISKYIDYVKSSEDAQILVGGGYDKSEGYFIEPTIVLTENPKFKTMCEEIFGPVLTIYVYEDDKFEETLDLVDDTSEYALTGSIFSQDRQAIRLALDKLRHSAGNFYINDKPTGSVVAQQPFGGARGSGTNDKAGSILNLYRWISVRTIKENFVPPTDYRYPFLGY